MATAASAAELRPPLAVGFIGIGKMGLPMARRLAGAGYELVVADASLARVDALLAETRNARAASLAQLGGACDVVITMLPDGKAVHAVLCGADGRGDAGGSVLAGLRAGSFVLDMSSSSPMGTRQLEPLLAARGVGLLDAPVSGGVKRATDGTLAIMVGGDAALLARARPLLAAMGRDIFHAGPLGAGHAIKALNNYVSAAGLVAAAEAVRIGTRFGLDPARMVDILNASTGRNNSTENKLKQFILPRDFASGFALALMAKDLRTAMDVAAATGTGAPLGAACVALWNDAAQHLEPDADHTAIMRYLELQDPER
jgi:3-hydroxyisobutyrate dehydrogenase